MIRTAADFKLNKNNGGNLYRHPGTSARDPIYCRFSYTDNNGRRRDVRRSTGKTVEREARAIAWEIWKEAKGIVAAGPELLRSNAPKLGVVAELFLQRRRDCSRASELVCRQYVDTLGRAVELVYGGNWRDIPINKLSAEFLTEWRRRRYAMVGKDFDRDADQDLYLNGRLNSMVQDMRGVFSRRAMVVYRSVGFALPEALESFRQAPGLQSANRGFIELPGDVDRRMQWLAQAAIHRARGVDYRVPAVDEGLVPSAAVAVAYELARFAGLTMKEIEAVRVDWFGEGLEYVEIRAYSEAEGGKFVTKSNSKNGRVPLAAARARYWLEALGVESGPVFAGSRHYVRKRLLEGEANGWIAGFLPDRVKRLHELRKQAGYDVFRAHGSLTAAARFLRDSEATAQSFYLPRRHDAGALGVVGL